MHLKTSENETEKAIDLNNKIKANSAMEIEKAKNQWDKQLVL